MSREQEIAIRWSEVHVKKLMEYQNRRFDMELYNDIHYTLENTYSIQIRFEFHCMNSDEMYAFCPHSAYDPGCIRGKYIPVLNVYMELYKDDLVLSIPFLEETVKPIRESLTHLYTYPPPKCGCGRLGKTHELESENGKCNNCYIYGFVRGDNCAICMSDDGKPWVKTTCDHYFHQYCWSRMNRMGETRCPMCRKNQEYVEEI